MLTICLVSLYTYAQDTYKGKIISTNNEPLAGATVQSKTNNSNAVVTDFYGNFSITLESNKAVIVKFIGFKTVEQILSRANNNIQLFENDQILEEVVISASREKQLRKEVPASISVISSKDISETKAFGIDQLINDVPGVNMTMSRAAGNEQHMMSVRSPISTKSLFLYVEDGLPIRPTAVFNHNALLEMNDVSFNRIEVLKGPASSIYGSESIGGSFNFITKKPTREFSGSLGFQINDLGLTKYELELSKYVSKKVGFYIGTQYIQRKNGPIEYSDYEKFAFTIKNVNHLSSILNWTNSVNLVDYRSDMTGSLSESDYRGGNFESDQTFTERVAFSFRFKSTLDINWNDKNKTTFNFAYRNNDLDQNPSYRVSQNRDSTTRELTGTGTGEINSNSFTSYVNLIQHKIDFDFANSSLIVGVSSDFSPQKYQAETLDVVVDTETEKNISFTLNEGDYILNYDADIFNYAGYFQYEINPTKALKLTAALRYDGFEYDYTNLSANVGGPKDSKNRYNNISPKLGANYNFSNNTGIYTNYSNGFTPPQTSSLYRNSLVGVGGEVFDLKPSNYNNYELGTYFKINTKLRGDIAVYLLDGDDTLVTLRDDNDNFFNANAGKTRSYGIEYGFKYNPIETLTISHNGTYAKHRYKDFFTTAGSTFFDLSNTDRETAPSLSGTSKITYKPYFVKGLLLNLTHELVGKYNTSFENQINNGDGTFSTATYNGHNIFNFMVSYEFEHFEVWGHALNIFDRLYSASASYNRFSSQNSYTIGNPRAFHFGLKYHF